MGTNKSSESLATARYLRSQRSLNQAQVDDVASRHLALARYATPTARTAPSAH